MYHRSLSAEARFDVGMLLHGFPSNRRRWDEEVDAVERLDKVGGFISSRLKEGKLPSMVIFIRCHFIM